MMPASHYLRLYMQPSLQFAVLVCALPGLASSLRLFASPARGRALACKWQEERQVGNGTEVDHLVQGLTPGACERFPAAHLALQELSEVYEGHVLDPFHMDGHAFNENFDRAWDQLGNASIYGEILPQSVVAMLASVGARPGMKYYDLGSGFGKTVILAGLLGLEATGVELVDQRWHASCAALSRARDASSSLHPRQVRMVHGDILNFDFSDADIVFTDSLAFSESMMDMLSQAARRMRPGTRIITAQPLDSVWFRDVATFKGPSTWASDSDWLIQEPRMPVAGDIAHITGLQKADAEDCSS
mmetsp:Transcript_51031/g.148133  ORF Transcript_51031/g.148133 Transcript_51031/m.148133 type:complete len:302 (-) Transcript_51031:105-1010(-)